MRLSFLAVVFSLLLPLGCASHREVSSPSQTDSGPIAWIEDDYQRALQLARKNNVPLVIDGWATWCHTCISMREYVLIDRSLAEPAKRFVWLALDTDKEINAPLLQKIRVDILPTFFVIDPHSEQVTARWLGAASLREFREFLDEGERSFRQTTPPNEQPWTAPLVKADNLAAQGELAQAIPLYEQALAAAPKTWGRADSVRSSLMTALRRVDPQKCLIRAQAFLPLLSHSSSAADLVAAAVDCAETELKKGGDAASGAQRFLTDADHFLAKLVDDSSAPLSVDDRSDAMGIRYEVLQSLGQENTATSVAKTRLSLLEQAAESAPTIRAASVFDAARAEVMMQLNMGELAVMMLRRREQELERDYNPVARLARVFFKLGRNPEALEAIDRAIVMAYGPRSVGMFGLKADILEKMGRMADVQATLEEQLRRAKALPAGMKRPALENAIDKRLRALKKQPLQAVSSTACSDVWVWLVRWFFAVALGVSWFFCHHRAAMARLEYTDHRSDPEGWAKQLGISREAVDIYLGSDVIDLHIDTFIWHRVFKYDLTQRHGTGALDARFYGQADFPRIREAAVTGATWVITTNIARGEENRPEIFLNNLQTLRGIFAQVPEDFAIVRNVAEYRAAQDAGKHAAFIGIQGGNALDKNLDCLDLIPDDLILRVTIVHLSTSKIGITSSPLAGNENAGLSSFGKEYVRKLNSKKIFVDLAHINRAGFFDAFEVHDKNQPLLVTHTGISGVHKHWRNLDDEQIRAIASTGGTIGIMYQSDFLGDHYWGGKAASIVDHLAHIIKTVGEDHCSLGSDWDGAIITPRDMPTCLELPKLVQIMLNRGWKPERIQKILGKNFLRVVEALRG